MEKINFQEQLIEDVKKKIEEAKNNPISETRLAQLEEEILVLGKRKDEEAFKREDEIEKELFASCAITDNVIEFKEFLKQIAEICGQSDEWVTYMLAHENAHSNVAEITGHENIQYIALFVKDEQGQIISIQPACYSKVDKNWGTVEVLLKRMAVTDAPRQYGNKPSNFDDQDMVEDKKTLAVREKTHAEEVDKIRKELGSLSKFD